MAVPPRRQIEAFVKRENHVRTARADFISSGRDSSAPLTVLGTVIILSEPLDVSA
jgi:hypothetical protein